MFQQADNTISSIIMKKMKGPKLLRKKIIWLHWCERFLSKRQINRF